MTHAPLRIFVTILATLIAASAAHAQPASQPADADAAVPLFNGRDIDGWTFNDEKQAAAWEVRDGVLYTTGEPTGYIRTRETYSDGVLSFDIQHEVDCNTGVLLRTTGKDKVWPRCIEAQGQKGNLGDIYLLGGFAVEHDGKRLTKGRIQKTGESNENPIGEWNHYDVVMDGGEITLYVNGEEKNHVTGADEEAGWIAFQSEGGGVSFRNITLTPVADWTGPEEEEETGAQAPSADSVSLFNGENLDGWSGQEGVWRVEDGTIIGETTKDNPVKENTFLVYVGDGTLDEPQTFRDFELTFEYQLEGQNNSGVQYRSRRVQRHVVAGYQHDIQHDPMQNAKLYDEKGRGRLAMPGQRVVAGEDGKVEVVQTIADEATLRESLRDGWNRGSITAIGHHLVQSVNGVPIVEITDLAPKGFDGEGILALQIHAGGPMRVSFRNLRLRPIDATDDDMIAD